MPRGAGLLRPACHDGSWLSTATSVTQADLPSPNTSGQTLFPMKHLLPRGHRKGIGLHRGGRPLIETAQHPYPPYLPSRTRRKSIPALSDRPE